MAGTLERALEDLPEIPPDAAWANFVRNHDELTLDKLTDAEREHALRVVAAFATAPAAGVVSLDGRMIDRPHLLQAQRILAVTERARGGT